MKILLICCDGEHRLIENNKGAEAVIIGTIELLRNIFVESEFVTTMQLSDRLSQRLRCRVIKNKLFATTKFSLFSSIKSMSDLCLCFLFGSLKKYLKINASLLLSNKKLKEYYQADIIIHIGMDLYSDDFGLISLLEHSKDILTAKALDKPVILWAESIGPFKKTFTRWLARKTLNRTDLIMLRERFSGKHLENIKVNCPTIRFTADPAFLVNPVAKCEVDRLLKNEGIVIDSKRPLIGFNITLTYLAGGVKKSKIMALAQSLYKISRYVLPGELFITITKISKRTRLYSVADVKQTGYIKLMAEIIDYLVERFNADIILIPHLQSEGLLLNDRVNHERVLESVKCVQHVKLIYGEYTAEELKGIIGQCDIFIGGKMHANIAALSQGIPTIGMAYSYKFHGIMDLLGQDNYVCDKISFKNMIAMVEDAWLRQNDIRKELTSVLPNIRELAKLNGLFVKEYFVNKKNG